MSLGIPGPRSNETPPGLTSARHPTVPPPSQHFFLPFAISPVWQALEETGASTPRDLVRLGGFPDVLIGAVRDRVGAERFAKLAGRMTISAVAQWRAKGQRVLEKRPWLERWVHDG